MGSRRRSPGDQVIGSAAAAMAAMLFGSAFVATAVQLRSFGPLEGALWRAGLAAVALIAVGSVATRRSAGPRRSLTTLVAPARLLRLVVIGSIGGFLFIIGMNVAVDHVGATITAFVAGLYAILAALFAPVVLDEPLERSALGGFVVALIGTALLADVSLGPDALVGLGAAGLAAVSFGLYLVLIRRWSAAIGAGPLSIGLANTLSATVGLLVLLGLTDPSAIIPTSIRPESVLATGWLALVAASGQLLVATAARRIEARRSSAFLLLNPITATVLAAILLGERPSPSQAVGGALVLLGIAVATGLVGALLTRRASPATAPSGD